MSKNERKETVVLNIPVSRQTLRSLLCTAVESGGSDYWAEFRDAERTEDLDYLRVRVIELEQSDDRPRRNRYITAEDLATGLERLAKVAADPERSAKFPAAGKHFADALGDHDAETADVVLQMTIFGELVYG
jgi:hypothetical protein